MENMNLIIIDKSYILCTKNLIDENIILIIKDELKKIEKYGFSMARLNAAKKLQEKYNIKLLKYHEL